MNIAYISPVLCSVNRKTAHFGLPITVKHLLQQLLSSNFRYHCKIARSHIDMYNRMTLQPFDWNHRFVVTERSQSSLFSLRKHFISVTHCGQSCLKPQILWLFLAIAHYYVYLSATFYIQNWSWKNSSLVHDVITLLALHLPRPYDKYQPTIRSQKLVTIFYTYLYT